MGIKRLHEIAASEKRTILGLMSGTSLDGLDMALCTFRGAGSKVHYEVNYHGTASYLPAQRQILREFATQKFVDMEKLCIYHAELSHWHAHIIRKKLNEWRVAAADVDLLASHGQTIRHAPKRIHNQVGLPNATFQLGEPDHLAHLTGIITISDFRQKHVAAGGEGAPLAVYGDQLLFAKEGEFRVLLNIGGIANITILDGRNNSDVLPITFDTGPGNTLIDRVVQEQFPDKLYDESGSIASTGQINNPLLAELISHPYFSEAPPKTTGPELLSPEMVQLALNRANIEHIAANDLIATLTFFTAESICQSIKQHTDKDQHLSIYVSGGGVHNRTMMHHLKTRLPNADIMNFDRLGVDPDAKEAVFFAALANEFVCGNPFQVIGSDARIRHVTFGKVSFPD
jgi:anhydro-N-acetylmuramic acid kinase